MKHASFYIPLIGLLGGTLLYELIKPKDHELRKAFFKGWFIGAIWWTLITRISSVTSF